MAGGIGTPGPPAKQLPQLMERLHIADEQLRGYTERMISGGDAKPNVPPGNPTCFAEELTVTVERIEASVGRLLELL